MDENEEENEEEEYQPDDKTLLLMPQTVAHRIDKTSPLYNLGQKELLNSKFEILHFLSHVGNGRFEGNSEETM